MNTLAVDLGFGATKICYKTPDGTMRYEKFTSAIAKVPHSNIIQDSLAFEFEGVNYYLFENATKTPNSSQLDLMSYKGLKEASPVILRFLMKKYGNAFDRIVIGLSVAMIDNSKDYREYISEKLHMEKDNVILVPQGVGSKIAYDHFNIDPSDKSSYSDTRVKDFIGIDMGFNTVDVYQCIDGKVSGNAIQGFEGEGVCKIAYKLIEEIHRTLGKEVSIQDIKEVLETGNWYYRGTTYPFTEIIDSLVIEYFKDLIKLLESKFQDSIDKMDRLLFVGGGAALLRKHWDALSDFMKTYYKGDFIVIPEVPEYYNVLGYYLKGVK